MNSLIQPRATDKNMKSERSAFSTIELLVVIGIIIIIASISVPAYISIKNNQKEKQAANEIKLIDEAIQRFRDDFGDYPNQNILESNSAGLTDSEKSLNQGNEILVACLYSVLPDKQSKSSYLHIGLTGEGGVNLADADSDGKKELLDPWGKPYFYFPNTDYASSVSHSYGTPGLNSITASAKAKSSGSYYRLTSYQIWSMGKNMKNDTNTSAAGSQDDDDIVNWSY
jgi:type II secretory pathway pseudopilin PulG